MSDVTPPPAAPQPAYGAPAGAKTNTLAIVALVLGILVPLGGVIVGPIALGQIKRTGEGGRGLALAGIIIGAVLILLYIIIIIVTVAASAALVNSGGYVTP